LRESERTKDEHETKHQQQTNRGIHSPKAYIVTRPKITDLVQPSRRRCSGVEISPLFSPLRAEHVQLLHPQGREHPRGRARLPGRTLPGVAAEKAYPKLVHADRKQLAQRRMRNLHTLCSRRLRGTRSRSALASSVLI